MCDDRRGVGLEIFLQHCNRVVAAADLQVELGELRQALGVLGIELVEVLEVRQGLVELLCMDMDFIEELQRLLLIRRMLEGVASRHLGHLDLALAAIGGGQGGEQVR